MLNISEQDIFREVYGLNKSQYKVFDRIRTSLGRTPLSVKDLVKKIDRDRTTIQKIIPVLMQKGLIIQRQRNLNRGFMFVYSSENTKKFVKDITTYYYEKNKQRQTILEKIIRGL